MLDIKKIIKDRMISAGEDFKIIPENLVDMMLDDISSIPNKLKFTVKLSKKYKEACLKEDNKCDNIDYFISEASREMGDNFIDKEFEWIAAYRKFLITKFNECK